MRVKVEYSDCQDREVGSGLRWLDVTGGQIPVRTTGSGHDAILLLHGWSLDHRAWDGQHAGLSDCARIVSCDRRGFGRASAPAGLSQEPDDVLKILDELDIASVWLVGQSQAARVAAAFALAHPGRVAGLVLQGTPPLAPMAQGVKDEIPQATYLEQIRSGDVEGMRARWLAHPLMSAKHPQVKKKLACLVKSYSGADLLSEDPGLTFESAIIHTLLCPTLILTGSDESDQRQAWAKELSAYLPIAEYKVLPESGHLCNLDNPDAFNEAIRRFIGVSA